MRKTYIYLLFFGLGALLMYCLDTVLISHFRFQGPVISNFSLKVANAGPTFYTKTFRVTAYCPCEKCCGRFADGITASGHKIEPNDKFVAAPKEYPFGTLMKIPEYSNVFVLVLDRGGSIKGDRLDVFFPTHEQALRWGVQIVEVRIYQNENRN